MKCQYLNVGLQPQGSTNCWNVRTASIFFLKKPDYSIYRDYQKHAFKGNNSE